MSQPDSVIRIWIAVADNAMLIEIASNFFEPWQRK
jgi:hypothetical protein